MLKIYGMLWLAIALVMAILFVTGNLTLTVAITFGFVMFGMVFMGMMGVLPASISHPAPPKQVAKIKEASPVKSQGRVHGTRSSAHA